MSSHSISEATAHAETNLQRQLEWIGRYDTRSATLLGINIAMLGFLSSELPKLADCNAFAGFAAALAVIALCASLISIYLGQYPRTNSPNASLIFFGTIAKLDRDAFSTDFCARTAREHLADLCDQTHANAVIIAKKFEHLKRALILLLLGAAPWTLAIGWLRLGTGV
jgi:hypothetical protein